MNQHIDLKNTAQKFLSDHAPNQKLTYFKKHEAVQKSLHFLNSDRAFDLLNQDPYWPKWDHPWWHILALKEMELVHLVPDQTLEAFLQSIKTHLLTFFPRTESELPKDCDPYRNILCFCALGCFLQVFHECGVDIHQALPWVEDWFETYLLPDGGYNCDDEAYRKTKPCSSFTSSLPIYEALLKMDPHKWKSIILQGVDYLESRSFCRSLSKNCVADPNWLKPGFPLFYEYDVIRGMQSALDSHTLYQTQLNAQAFNFALDALLSSVQEKLFRSPLDYTSFSLRQENGQWQNGETQSFALLDFLGQAEIQSQFILQKISHLCLGIMGFEA